MTPTLHPHSVDAHAIEKNAGRFNQREMMILAALRRVGSITDRGLMLLLGFTEPNQVRPRITHLIKVGAVIEAGSTICGTTGKRVRLLRHAHREFQESFL